MAGFLTFRFNLERASLVFNQWRVSSTVRLISSNAWVGEASVSDVSPQAASWPARLQDCVWDESRSDMAATVQSIPPYNSVGVNHFAVAPDGAARRLSLA
mmetsp:Transcript_12731/g.29676  ORF Transcript_12731/g.29676 Transcript_12731/m.29676 type:complete len:100 (-) Transcript_12731:395-694(-)